MTLESVPHHVLGMVAVMLAQSRPPSIPAIPNVPEREIVLKGQRYEDSGLGDRLGFYDWLRSSDGDVVGIRRLWMDDELTKHKPLLEGLTACMNVAAPSGGPSLFVKFDGEWTVAPDLSDDQDFGSDRLFIGPAGFVLTFNAPTARAAGATTDSFRALQSQG